MSFFFFFLHQATYRSLVRHVICATLRHNSLAFLSSTSRRVSSLTGKSSKPCLVTAASLSCEVDRMRTKHVELQTHSSEMSKLQVSALRPSPAGSVMLAVTAFRMTPSLPSKCSYPAQNPVNMKWLYSKNDQLPRFQRSVLIAFRQ